MSRPLSNVEAICREFRCTYCGAEPGNPCQSKSGRRASMAHGDRWYEALLNGRFAS